MLFAGQAIVESDAPVAWRTALGEHMQMVDWETCPDSDVQTETIAGHIRNLALDAAAEKGCWMICGRHVRTNGTT